MQTLSANSRQKDASKEGYHHRTPSPDAERGGQGARGAGGEPTPKGGEDPPRNQAQGGKRPPEGTPAQREDENHSRITERAQVTTPQYARSAA
eukprot:13128968-Alexandrium_andersonii.AAC.1